MKYELDRCNLLYFTIIINLYIVLRTLRQIMSIVMNPWVCLLFHSI